ncbi:aldehyde ferredoxin oxidoreductase family protein [Desulfosarcina cetonica]|uniref:aldehyde ferredoxin oxidoreductase family protein n=1 Tax=Desulfosarcina cetonica TaxID=90730 RepID=UPI000AB71B5B|nr:aldehyde ferredoxin oxidoreductase N-terminal domain-containing protein [Desulfosarcina cetonica]
MKSIVGTSNRIIEINLSTASIQAFQVGDDDRRQYLGGAGLGLKLLYERMTPGVDPLGEENWLAFMMGVLMGTGAPCSGRFAAVTKSPLTGIMLTATCGGPFGMAYKTSGYDGLLVTGCAATPVVVEIDGDGVNIEDGRHLWGLDTRETQQQLNLNRNDGALVIGPAGENQVLFASVASGTRFIGRGGVGAVMGAKGIKAIVARGRHCKIVPADPKRFADAKRRATRDINSNPITADDYRNFGTASHVNGCNAGGILPVCNFHDGSHSQADQVSGETLRERYQPRPSTCKPCSIICGHKGRLADGRVCRIPEYESVALLGPNLGIFDPDFILHINDRCGLLGLDPISAGGVLAWCMEAGEKGVVETELKFGVIDGIEQTLEDTAYRRGWGEQLADGTRLLSQRYGGSAFAIQVKGMELSGYDPRGAWGVGLADAVANPSACHHSAAIFFWKWSSDG